ncbi:hypothetical protein FBEOM_10729 [Fusarium beomiforme]|uniref:Uncharacterized protein n=1 Tax=Fusarium beomiforme TaxID=44412 RepID=A0A9P5DUN6_9HYPO|nr:hypothetical protein FBEOM_10729 [Fusarium beomiforme]
MTPKAASTRKRVRPPRSAGGQSSPDYPTQRAYHAASRIHQFCGMWPNELCKGFVPDMWGIRLIEGLSALVGLVMTTGKVDIEEVRRRLKGHANHHPRTNRPQLRKSDIAKVRKWLRGMGIDTKHTRPPEQRAGRDDQSDDEAADSDATEADSEPVDEIVALGLPEDRISDYDDDEEEDEEDQKEELEMEQEQGEEQQDEEEEEVEEKEDEDDLDWAAPSKKTASRSSKQNSVQPSKQTPVPSSKQSQPQPKKQTPPQERHRLSSRELVEMEVDNIGEDEPAGESFMMHDGPEPAQVNGHSAQNHTTPSAGSTTATSRPRRSIQQPSRLVSDTPTSSVRRPGGSEEYTSVSLAVRSPSASQQRALISETPVPLPKQSNMLLPQNAPAFTPTNAAQSSRPQSQTTINFPKIPTPQSAMHQGQRSNSQPSSYAAIPSPQSSIPPRTQASSQPVMSPHTSATSQTPQLAPSQQMTPRSLAPSQGNKRQAESYPQNTYLNSTAGYHSRSSAKRQRTTNAQPQQSQASGGVDWNVLLPSGDGFKNELKASSDAIKHFGERFEQLLASVNDEHRRLSAVQRSLFKKRDELSNDQRKAQDALKDVEKSTANENKTLRDLEEVYNKNPDDAELRVFIDRRKKTILEHHEVYTIVKSQLDKSSAGLVKTDQEIAVVTKRLAQLDAERVDIMREKEGYDKTVKKVTIMLRFMEPGWGATLDMLEQAMGAEALGNTF